MRVYLGRKALARCQNCATPSDRESLSATLRTLRAESLRQANDIQRLQEKFAEAQRKTRSSCANEVRKRDRQIESLKKATTEAGRARGAGRSTGITTITVVGDIGSEAEHGVPSTVGTEQGPDLRTETNAFLAELAKGLSEENEGLLQLVRRTTEQLKEMSGWDVANGNPTDNGDGHVFALAANPADMSLEVDAVLNHLRTILTNPSFVPIEEVVVREDEIHRLRDGWEKMETRWKEAVHLIDGWRKRMQASGRPVNVEELKMGLRLSPVKVKNVEETSHGYALRLEAVLEDEEVGVLEHHYDEESLDLVPEPEADDAESDASSEFEHDLDELDVEEPNVEILEQSVMLASPPLPSPPQLSALRDPFASGNKAGRPDHRKHARDFPTIAEEKTRDLVEDEPPLPPPHGVRPQQSPQRRPILSLRTVPPEEAARVALPPSAAVSTPDTSVDSIPFGKPSGEPTSKTSTASAKSQKRPPPAARKREPVKVKEASRKDAAAKEATGKEPVKDATRKELTKEVARKEPAKEAARKESAKEATRKESAREATRKEATKETTRKKDGEESKPFQAANKVPANQATDYSGSPTQQNLPKSGVGNISKQSPLSMATITASRAASERDADAARVRAKLKAARLGKGVSPHRRGTTAASASTSTSTGSPTEREAADANSATMSTRSFETDSVTASASTSNNSDGSGALSSTTTTTTTTTATTRDDDADELGFSPPLKRAQQQAQQQEQQEQQPQQKQPARKRERRASKTASRRRSTLNPWELDALMQGGKVAVER
ncbi:hypothetical protein NEMBOFW57_004882 [Staphylotrichum longicolle]|uniref:NIMA interactive protein n=1 Tax=Staphylotrichum longicolle TaxID=669026 RepID=A0AAD4HVL9_9PEZI|nr:hypothetical protein NEMBOFW57_004882 [Staphylotrichum longicolle]